MAIHATMFSQVHGPDVRGGPWVAGAPTDLLSACMRSPPTLRFPILLSNAQRTISISRRRRCVNCVVYDEGMLPLRRAALVIPLGLLGVVLVLAFVGIWALPTLVAGRILPGIAVQRVSLSGRTPDEARALLASLVAEDGAQRVRFSQGGVVVREPAAVEVGASLDVERTLLGAVRFGREGGLEGFFRRIMLVTRGVRLPAVWQVNPVQLTAYLTDAFALVLQPPREPRWELERDGSFVFQPGGPGTAFPWEEVTRAVTDRLAQGSMEPVPLVVISVPPALTDADARVAGAAAEGIATRPLVLTTEDTNIMVPTADRARWVRIPSALQAGAGAALSEPELDRAAVEAYLRKTVAPQVARPPVDAQFVVSGNRATTFIPSQPGVELLVPESAQGIVQGLAADAEKIRLVTRPVAPKVLVTPLMDEYGIRMLLARGESDFAGSPRNRIHNIRVGAEKYQGLLVPPGAEFSFNTNLGPVDGEHGFLRELVILANVTTPQFGGGLCQVSTTMFRAAIHAGVPITARKNHAYAVSYYGTPGFDATIYPPNPDLRFVNDTPGYLLMQTKLEGATLAFEFWGSPDDRRVEVLGPFPYDRKPDGAVKATLVRKIIRGGRIAREEWQSAYKSPKLFPKVLAANAENETWEQRVQRIAEKDRRIQEEFERKQKLLQTGRGQEAVGSEAKATPRATPKPTPEPE